MKTIITLSLFLLPTAVTAGTPVTSSDQAVNGVLELTGLANDLDLRGSRTAQIVSFKDTTIPFIPDTESRRAWRVEFTDVKFGNQADQPAYDIPKTVEVYVDSSSGELLKIVFRPQKETNLVREPTSEESTQLLKALGENYHGFPQTSPHISLMAAMNRCKFYPLHSDEVIVWYVNWSLDNAKPYPEQPVWVIYMRGTLPVSDHEWIPIHQRNHRRVVVGMNGEVLMSNNVPYPELDEQNK